jgi:hypothetical protein
VKHLQNSLKDLTDQKYQMQVELEKSFSEREEAMRVF